MSRRFTVFRLCRQHFKRYWVDIESGCPNALLLPNPTLEKVAEGLADFISKNGIPKRIRIDLGTVFNKEKGKQLCTEKFIDQIESPVIDHRGEGKVETIKEDSEQIKTY